MARWFGFTQSNVLTSHGIWIQIMLIRLRMLLRRLRLRFLSVDMLPSFWLPYAAIFPTIPYLFLLLRPCNAPPVIPPAGLPSRAIGACRGYGCVQPQPHSYYGLILSGSPLKMSEYPSILM